MGASVDSFSSVSVLFIIELLSVLDLIAFGLLQLDVVVVGVLGLDLRDDVLPLLRGHLLGNRVLLESPFLGEFELIDRNLLGGNTDRDGEEANHVGHDVHSGGKLASAEQNGGNRELLATVVDHGLLHGELDSEDDDKPLSVHNAAEDVEVVRVGGSHVKRVEQVHQNKHVEDESVHDESVGAELGLGIAQLVVDDVGSLVEAHHESTEEHEDEHDEHLEGGLHKDGSPHVGLHETLGSLLSLGEHIGAVVGPSLSGKRDGSQNVHDEVHPKHLNDVQRRMANDTADDGDDRDGDVDSQLEGQEALHILVEKATPHEGSADLLKVILQQHKVRLVLSDVTAGAHGNADIGNLESISISNALTDHGDMSAVGLQGSHKKLLVERSAAIHDSHLTGDRLHEVLELVLVLNDYLAANFINNNTVLCD